MNADQILAEIREANLSYLMLAQSLIRTDRDQALEQGGQIAAAVVGRHADAEQGGRGVGHDGAVEMGIGRFWPARRSIETRKNGPSTPLIGRPATGHVGSSLTGVMEEAGLQRPR